MDPLLSLSQVRFLTGGGVCLLDQITFQVYPGERLAIVGEEGNGKSVLVRIMAGLVAPVAGRLVLDGQPLAHWSPRQRVARLGVVFGHADPCFLASRVWEEVALGAANLGLTGAALEQRVVDSLVRAGVPLALREAHIPSLAASQRSRVALAATLACRPRLVVADEPGLVLSDSGETALAAAFGQWCREEGLALVLVTSRRQRAERFADRLLWLRQGCLHATEKQQTP